MSLQFIVWQRCYLAHPQSVLSDHLALAIWERFQNANHHQQRPVERMALIQVAIFYKFFQYVQQKNFVDRNVLFGRRYFRRYVRQVGFKEMGTWEYFGWRRGNFTGNFYPISIKMIIPSRCRISNSNGTQTIGRFHSVRRVTYSSNQCWHRMLLEKHF